MLILSLLNKINTSKNVEAFEKLLSAVLILILAPVWAYNFVLSVLLLKPLVRKFGYYDFSGNVQTQYVFNTGILKKSLTLIEVIRGKKSIVGVSSTHSTPLNLQNYSNIKIGLISLVDIHHATGLSEKSDEALILEQQSNSCITYTIKIIIKYFLCQILFRNKKSISHKKFRLFGLGIDNYSMKEAVKWIVTSKPENYCKLVFFANTHSVNLSLHNSELKSDINAADRVFADGSGMRIASNHIGETLKDNVNGTDLLPHLCKLSAKKGKSLFFLGAQEGVAAQAAKNLKKSHSGLTIAGTQHGYFNSNQTQEIIDKINQSGADILLVAMGSPIQERWLTQHRHKLHCQCALAVGGLFDFYSGLIPRAPQALRELGMEWVWRLIQEPSKKFHRYVIGNPEFLFRTFVLNQAGTIR